MIELVLIALLVAADDKDHPSTTIEGHTLRVDGVSVMGGGFVPPGQQGRALKSVSITFAAEPKDAGKSYAYEIGQRFVARDAAGKEIPMGPVRGSGMREPSFRLAGYPAKKDDPVFAFRDAMTTTLPLQDVGVASLATLEGDLFVSEVETLEFTFAGKELDPNCVKTANGAEAKLVMFDEIEHGFNIGFKLKVPVRSYPDALLGGGGRGFVLEPCLLFATDGGRKFPLRTSGSSTGGGGGASSNDSRQRLNRDFHAVGLDRRPEALHLLILHLEPPRRLPFQLKDVPIPAAAPPRQVPPRKIALNRF